jgi:hypothetical protein
MIEPTDISEILRKAEEERVARAALLPTEQDCIRLMMECRQRLIELGWQSGEYSPKDGRYFQGIEAGFAGPSSFTHLGETFFVFDGSDMWPSERPLVWKEAS